MATDHTLEVNFKVDAKAMETCTTVDVKRDEWVIRKMAQAISVPGTPTDMVIPQAFYEAARVYTLITAMRLALEEEVRANTTLTRAE